MSLPDKPLIAPALLRKCPRPYDGPIEPGDVFAWEPDLPHARELCVVVRIDQPPQFRHGVCTRPLDGDEETWNHMDRFREAVVPTIFNRMPLKRRVDWPATLSFPKALSRAPLQVVMSWNQTMGCELVDIARHAPGICIATFRINQASRGGVYRIEQRHVPDVLFPPFIKLPP